jgi:hypothetical protein
LVFNSYKWSFVNTIWYRSIRGYVWYIICQLIVDNGYYRILYHLIKVVYIMTLIILYFIVDIFHRYHRNDYVRCYSRPLCRRHIQYGYTSLDQCLLVQMYMVLVGIHFRLLNFWPHDRLVTSSNRTTLLHNYVSWSYSYSACVDILHLICCWVLLKRRLIFKEDSSKSNDTTDFGEY